MRQAMRVLGGAVVVSLAAAGVNVFAETPTEAHFVVCNSDAQAAMKAGTAIPTAKDYMRVEAARKKNAATSTEAAGPLSTEFSDPQLIGMATDGITDADIRRHTARACVGMDSERPPAGEVTQLT
jgi:hypothetical protein